MAQCYIILLVIVIASALSLSKESGPFKIILTDVKDQCFRTTRPFAKLSPMTAHIWIYNTSLIGANITLNTDLKNLRGIISVYREENGRSSLNTRYEKIDCKNFLMPVLMKLWGYKPWKDFCTIPKGTYFLKYLDANQAYHLWKKELDYDNKTIRTEVVRGMKTVLCFEIKLRVAPETAHRTEATTEPHK